MKLAPVFSAVGVGGLLSAFGYTALRAHWNFLGITAGGGVPAERYIAETWSIVAGATPLLLLAVLVLLVLWGLTAGGRKLLLRYAPDVQKRAETWFPLLLLALLLVAQILILRTISSADPLCRTDVLLGDLRAKREAGCFTPPDGHTAFVLVLAVVVASFIATHGEPLTRLQWIARVAAVAVALQLPAVYGCTIKQPAYRVVRVVAGGSTVDGLLVLQTSHHLQLWDATGGLGRMRFFPANALTESGSALDVFKVAEEIATSAHPNAFQQLCNRHFAHGGR
ncbi:MAG TPA: hypothetical protein VND45_14965 [Thermoanaerobaculia bacterium]|jgi:hypothetical protein|nr:hypothetical protein [Thermoanaerobaculia bacterium]